LHQVPVARGLEETDACRAGQHLQLSAGAVSCSISSAATIEDMPAYSQRSLSLFTFLVLRALRPGLAARSAGRDHQDSADAADDGGWGVRGRREAP
jgi:hypothetical protein